MILSLETHKIQATVSCGGFAMDAMVVYANIKK